MLLPNQWVGGDREQRVEVFLTERAQLDEITNQDRLEFEGHETTVIDHATRSSFTPGEYRCRRA
jgi:hypothetical protein